MSILSFKFAVFLTAAILLYFLTPGKHQWKMLLVISYIFYLFAGLKAVIFILFTSVSTYLAGLRIGKINDEFDVAVANYSGPNPKMTRAEKNELKKEEDRRKKKIMVLTLILNFGLLIALKYINALGGVFNSLCSLFNIVYELPQFSMLVPLGISYYTFQSMGYIIDLYRRKFAPEKNLPKFMLFISFFPQLIQGPISRFDELSVQLYEPHRFDPQRLKHGLELAAWGLFKKLVISDRIAIITSTVFTSPDRYPGFYLLVATILSMLQLYTDFSGGIDMTRGAAEIFGVYMPENFTRPFFATNLSEYWRRWHITLNNWWRDYIFYPLTLSKPFMKFGKVMKKIVGEDFGKKLPILLSIIIIRIINSIWHGATGSSILGGLYYGLILAFSFYFEAKFKKLNELLKINTNCLTWKIFTCLRTFALIAAPRLVTYATSVSDGADYFRCLFKTWNPWVLFDGSLYNLGVTQPQFFVVVFSLLLLLLVSSLQEKGMSIRAELDKQNLVFRGMIFIVFIYAIVLFGVYGSGYDASAFAYALI